MLKRWGLLVFVIVFTVFFRQRFTPRQIETFPNPIPEQYRPGAHTRSLVCDYHYYDEPGPIPCYRGDMSFMWNRYTDEISHTAMTVPSRPLGDYIVAWGTPTAQYITGICRYIYWDVTGVLICARAITPYTPVTMVVMSKTVDHQERWSGFSLK